MDNLQTVITDTENDGTPAYSFTPWTDGHAIGFKVRRHRDGAERFIYLNPSTETWSDGKFNPDVFVYQGEHGTPDEDDAEHFYNIEFDVPTGEHTIIQQARHAIDVWRGGPKMYDAEEFDAAMGDLAAALPTKREPAIPFDPETDPF